MQVQIYPNPAQNDLFVSFSEMEEFEEGEIILIDLNGRAVMRTQIFEFNNPIHVNLSEYQLSGGIYLLSVFVERENVLQKRIILMD